jgi:hypothetical protein
MTITKILVTFAILNLAACASSTPTDEETKDTAEAVKGAGASCSVSPNPVAPGGALTVTGTIGHSGDSVTAYLVYSDSSQSLPLGGPAGSGGSFSLSGQAQSLSGPAPGGSARADIYAVSPQNLLKVLTTSCSFSVN